MADKKKSRLSDISEKVVKKIKDGVSGRLEPTITSVGFVRGRAYAKGGKTKKC